MDSTERRIAKLADYSRICLSTLENAGLTLALLRSLIEDRELEAKHVQANAFIAHQHLANTLAGSFLTEVFSISEGIGCQQASLRKIRNAIEDEECIIQRLEALLSSIQITHWDDPDGLIDEMMLERLRMRDAKRSHARVRELRQEIMEDHDTLISSDLYKNSKNCRDKILAHKDTWKCNKTGIYLPGWFDRFGLKYSDLWTLYGRLGQICKSCHLLLTRSDYALGDLNDESEAIATRFWCSE